MVFMFITATVLAEICYALPLSGSIYIWAAESTGSSTTRTGSVLKKLTSLRHNKSFGEFLAGCSLVANERRRNGRAWRMELSLALNVER